MTAGIDPAARPRLGRGVKLMRDESRDSHVLLYPEGVLLPNETGEAVLLRCDGNSPVGEIVRALEGQFDGVLPEQILELLDTLRGMGLIRIDHDGA
ncbi:pyrroloquinoline quinone biosynthesis peptide chaperone PqqD [Actinoalloteichus spitiensis]|uniref:pyrroloquinoline quinone biosynthesis peptide chaperone PqqD n=1 Tax=Actinoalloteichus spitiensis TaxID=252394 RepID=UPI0003720E5E|nr:pyrroloquinoline quinone biosynthesis peptide chaperone PqqD [Actinoalloteichus spitiensis]